MAYLISNPANETDGGSYELDGASSIVSADVGGFTYVFVAGNVDNGVSVFRLNANGTLTAVYDLTDGGTLKLAGARGLSTAMVGGYTYLFAAGDTDDGVSVFRVNTNGSLTPVYDVSDDATLRLDQAYDTATARVGGNSYLFVAGQIDDGISVFSIAANGQLANVGNTVEGGLLELDGVRTLATVTVGANTFLLAGGGVDDGVSVFQVSAAGALTGTNNVTDGGALELDGVSDIATATIGGITYVYVTGADDSGVSVFSLSSGGVLNNIDNETDSATTLIAGANSVSVVTLDGANYLAVGGTENGLSLYRIETGANGSTIGSLAFIDNIADAGSLELAGTVSTHVASVGGTSYLLAGGQTDDGVSVFGSSLNGRLFFTTQEPGTDAQVAYVNSDGFGQTILANNVPTPDLQGYYPQEVGVDTAAGFYFLVTNNNNGDHALLLRGSLNGVAAPVTAIDFTDTLIINTVQLDAVNRKLYVGYQDGSGFAPANTGIRVYSYDAAGTLADNGFLVTAATDSRGQEAGFDVLDPHDFALDSTIGRLFYTEYLSANPVNGIFRLDLASPNVTTQLVSQAQFPDDGSGGFIVDVEVDTTTDLVYFTTLSRYPSPDAIYNPAHNGLWYISESASNGTATQVVLTGLPVGHHIYPDDMTFDQATRRIYIESEDTFVSAGAGANNDVIYVFQLDGAGTSAALINTITLSPQFTNDFGQFGGLTFAQLASLGALSGTGTAIAEQGAAANLLLAAPTITDDGGYLASATVRISGGTFVSNESSFTDDTLGYGAAMQQSGTVAGTSITVSWSQATGTLTLTGYDTFAHYATALSGVRFQSTGDNPTNYGFNTTRTITWTANDGTLALPEGSQSSRTTTVTISGVNDAPTSASLSGDTATWTNGGGAIALDVAGNATVADLDSLDFNGGTLTVHIGNVVAAVDQLGLGAVGGVTSDATTVSVGGVQIATYTGGGAGGGDLVFTFDADGTPAAVQSLIRAVTYNNTGGGSPSGGTRNVSWTLTDGDGGAGTLVVNSSVNVIDVNDEPAGTDHTASINEDATYAFAAADFGFSDPDGNSFSGVRFTTLPGAGTIYLDTDGGGPGAPIAVGAGNIVALSEISAGHVTYVPAANGNGTGYASFTFQVRDNGGTAGGGFDLDQTPNTFTIDVTAVNDAPVNTVPGAQTINEDATRIFTGGALISVGDVDLGAGNLTVTVGVAHGQLTLSGVAGLVFGVGDGTADATMTFSGTQAAINTALAGLAYAPNGDFNGTDTLTVTTNDNGNTGVDPGLTGGAANEQDSDTVTINLTAINDAPVVVGGGTEAASAIDEDTPGAGDTVNTLFAGHYSDAADNQIPNGGASSPGSFGGIAVIANGSAGASGQWQYFNSNTSLWVDIGARTTATALLINASTLVRFTPAANFNGPAPTLTAHLIDNSLGFGITFGQTANLTAATGGTTAYSTGTVVLSQAVNAVNDAPVNTVGATVNATEDDVGAVLSTTGSAMAVSDVDAPGLVAYSLSVSNGTLTIRTDVAGGIVAGDIQVLAGTGNGTAVINLSATVAKINATLAASNGLTYTPDANFAGTDTLEVFVNDAGQTGLDTNPASLLEPTSPGIGAVTEEDFDSRSIIMAAVDDAPVAQPDAVTTAENVILNGGAGALFANNGSGVDSDVDGPALSISAVGGGTVGSQFTLSSGAKLTVNADGSYSYDPNGQFDYLISSATAAAAGAANVNAIDSFTYTLTGGNTVTVSVTVTGVTSAGDELWGNALGNTVNGTAGVDYFDLSQGGDDTVSGNDGNDGFYFGGAFTADDAVHGGAGDNDQIGLEGDYSGGLTLGAGTITGIEVIAVLPGHSYSLTTVNANVPNGGTLKIFAGNLGAGDNFTFNGAAELDGNFMVYAGAGTDIVTTGAGVDGIYFGPSKFDPLVDRVDGGTGANDQFALDGHYAITLDGTAIKNIDAIVLLKGIPGDLATYNLTLANSLVGATETMTLWGMPVETAITINGAAETDGNLKIFGGSAGDTLTGGDGADWFWGGAGGDSMTGGAGADTFMYEAAAESQVGGFDRLIEFDQSVDKIDLPFAVSGFAGPPSGGSLSAATMGAQLEAAFTGLAANQAAGFFASGGDMVGRYFVVVDANGAAGFQTGSDFVIEFVSPVTSPVADVGMFI